MNLRRSPLPLLVLIALAVVAPEARAALRPGDTCSASRDATLEGEGGLRTNISAGDTIEVIKPGRAFSRVLVGDLEGRLPTPDLEEICAPARDLCTLKDPIKMTEARARRGKKRAFKIKPGAELEVLERGKKRVRVRVGDLEGIVKRDELEARCVPNTRPAQARDDDQAASRAGDDGAGDGPQRLAFPELPPVTPAPPGVKVALLPFAVDPRVDPVALRAIEDDLGRALVEARTDAQAFLEQPGLADARDRSLKDQLNLARRVGEAMGVDVVITGLLAPSSEASAGTKGIQNAKAAPDAEAQEAAPAAFRLQLAAVDVKAAKMVKGVTLHPTLRPEDPWASATARLLEGALPAGGARPAPDPEPAPATPGPKEGARTTSPDAWPDSHKPWFRNGLAYTTLGAAALFAAGGAATGGWAWLDTEAYRAAAQGAPGRPALADQAFTKGIVADSLYAAAIVLTATTGVLFLTGVDYETFEGR